MSCGSRRRIACDHRERAASALDERVAGEVVVGVAKPERDVARRRVVQVAHHDRVVDEPDRHVARRWRSTCAPWPPRSSPSACQLRWSGARFSQTAASARNARSTPAGSCCTRRRTRRSSRRARRRAARRCCRPRRAQAGGAQHRDREQGRRGLAVGAGDGEHRPRAAGPRPAPTGRRGRSRSARAVVPPSGCDHGCVSGTPGAGETQIESATRSSIATGVGQSSSTPSSSASSRLSSSMWSSATMTSCPCRAGRGPSTAPVIATP